MANAVIGALRVVLGMDSAAFRDGASQAEQRAEKLRKRMLAVGKSMQKIGLGMTAAITAPLVAFGRKAVEAARVQQEAEAQVSAALKSMGDGAGYTFDQLTALASLLQNGSTFGDEEILAKVTSNLLTFGNITGDTFARTQQLALDLSAALSQDLQSSTVMLGKALNEPAKGLTALTRVGVSFTEEQQRQIKAMAEAGDVAGAQALMLAELEKQYGGQARALANTDSGKITSVWNAIGDTIETIGAIILPIVAEVSQRLAEWVKKFDALAPKTQKFIVKVAAIAAALGPVVMGLGLVVAAAAPLAGLFVGLSGPALAVVGILGTVAALAWQNRDAITAWVDSFGGLSGLENTFPKTVNFLKGAMSNLGEAIKVLFSGTIEAEIGFARAFEALLTGDLLGAFSEFSKAMATWSITILDTLLALIGTSRADIKNWVIETYNDGVEWGRNLIAGIMAGIAEKWAAFKAWVTGKFQELFPNWGRNPDAEAAGKMLGNDMALGVAQGIGQGAAAGEAAIVEYLGGIETAGRDAIDSHSPSRVFAAVGADIMAGLGLGMEQGAAGTVSVFEKVLAGLGTTSEQVFTGMGSLIAGLIKRTTTLTQAITGMLSSYGSSLISSGLGGIGQAVSATAGPNVGGFVQGLLGGMLGFANGGSAIVGGVGGIDSQIVSMRATPGELIDVKTPRQQRQGFGGEPVQIVVRAVTDPSVILDISSAAAGVAVQRAEAGTVQKSVAAVRGQMRGSKSFMAG